MPDAFCNRSTASGKFRLSVSRGEAYSIAIVAATKAMVEAFSSLTVKDGVFSLWNGQKPSVLSPTPLQ